MIELGAAAALVGQLAVGLGEPVRQPNLLEARQMQALSLGVQASALAVVRRGVVPPGPLGGGADRRMDHGRGRSRALDPLRGDAPLAGGDRADGPEVGLEGLVSSNMLSLLIRRSEQRLDGQSSAVVG